MAEQPILPGGGMKFTKKGPAENPPPEVCPFCGETGWTDRVQATAWRSYYLGFKTRILTEASVATTASNQSYVETEICPMLGGTLAVDEFLESVSS